MNLLLFMNLFKYSRVKAAKQNIRSGNKSIEYLIERVDKFLLLVCKYLCICGRFKDTNLCIMRVVSKDL